MSKTLYRDYQISENPCNIARECDFVFSHKDFDGAPDANDSRCGFGPTVDDCMAQIDDLADVDGIVTTGA